ncbi:hypothetical protein J6590_096791 [Homalodisca vitripennis]|nr:hypothetical protein J6590_096791 [Homalodisca vitripennis]
MKACAAECNTARWSDTTTPDYPAGGRFDSFSGHVYWVYRLRIYTRKSDYTKNAKIVVVKIGRMAYYEELQLETGEREN